MLTSQRVFGIRNAPNIRGVKNTNTSLGGFFVFNESTTYLQSLFKLFKASILPCHELPLRSLPSGSPKPSPSQAHFGKLIEEGKEDWRSTVHEDSLKIWGAFRRA